MNIRRVLINKDLTQNMINQYKLILEFNSA